MNYQETLDYLFNQLPMYQRVGKAAYKSDLSNTIKLCELLGNPERKFKSVHIAGTNGKGSTSHMMASVLQEAGYKVGLYTSPHLKDFRERIKINGCPISQEDVVAFVEKHQHEFEAISLSFFEWTVGLAFTYFAKEKVDIAIVETGLGGRLDSTNVVLPELSIITNIGLDHTQFLGDTIEKIAAEKAGIIKRGVPVLIGERQDSIKTVFTKKAEKEGAKISFAYESSLGDYNSDLKGYYQKNNIKNAVCGIKMLQEMGWEISDKNLVNGLNAVVPNTGLMGRWQVLQEQPKVVCDTGHNIEGITTIVKQLNDTKYEQLHMVFGVVNDKSVEKVLSLLPKSARYYFCQANIPRAMEVKELMDCANSLGFEGEAYVSVSAAIESAKENANPEDLIFIGGSTFVVAEAL